MPEERYSDITQDDITILAPCPLCGGKNLDLETYLYSGWEEDEKSFAVGCKDCVFFGPDSETRNGAIEKWNKRVTNIKFGLGYAKPGEKMKYLHPAVTPSVTGSDGAMFQLPKEYGNIIIVVYGSVQKRA